MPNCALPLSRREFGLALCGLPFSLSAADYKSMPWDEPANIAKVYLASPRVHWPKPTLDSAQDIKEVEARLAQVQRMHAAEVRFTGGDVIANDEDARKWLAKTTDADGVLMIPITQPTPALGLLTQSLDLPVLYFSRPYASHTWGSIAGIRKGGKKIEVVATSSYGDLDPYMRMFRTARHMRRSKVLVGVATPNARQAQAAAYSKYYGTAFRFVSGPEFVDAFRAADEREARKQADALVRGALRVMEPTQQEILAAVRFSIALANMLKKEQANAVTIDCFGSLAANTLPGYPCVAWSKFNDAGLYGVCEGDLASTMTQLLITSYSGVPGFVSDPVFDLSRNEVIHAHCVSATKMKGPNGPAAPYILRNHLETNEGAVMQVLMPSGETITVARYTAPNRLLISTAEVTGAVESDRGCRTQIRTRVSNAEKWLNNYSAGLHRVIFYGDHVQAVERMGRLMGFEVAHEM
ncbi:MAG: hypothetical protein ACE15B_14760 [Bryobacteraceae bacterium]